MNVFENPVLVRGLAIASSGVVLGLLISVCRGLGRLVWKYKQEAASVPIEELLPAIGMAFTPGVVETLAVFALVGTIIVSARLSV